MTTVVSGHVTLGCNEFMGDYIRSGHCAETQVPKVGHEIKSIQLRSFIQLCAQQVLMSRHLYCVSLVITQ